MTQQEFIKKMAACAVSDMGASGILASVTIAQAILESGYGTTDLAVNANNFFGMKCSLSGNTWNSAWDKVSKYTKQTKEQKADGTEYTVTADFRVYPDMEHSVADHSLYFLGAKKGSDLRYKGLQGEKTPRVAIQIIKDGGYATDVKYVDKVLAIIDRYNLTQYDVPAAEKEDVKTMSIQFKEDFVTTNPCYKQNRKLDMKGGMLHSVGCPQPDPKVFVKNWKNPNAVSCVHAVVGVDPVVYQLMPWTMRGWHGGGSSNNNLVSIEMTEPSTIKYVGGATWVELADGKNTKSHVLATYRNAVEFYAYIFKKYGMNPLDSNNLMSHHEGCLKGVASNHGDVEHLWKHFGLTMDQFRLDVQKAMAGIPVDTVPVEKKPVPAPAPQTVKPLSGTVEVIYKGTEKPDGEVIDDGINIRKSPDFTNNVSEVVHCGAKYEVKGISADEKWYQLADGRFITTIPQYVKFKATTEQKQSTAGTGYFRVRKTWANADSQIGAFKSESNAVELCKQNRGYKVFNNDGIEVYPCNVVYPTTEQFKFSVDIDTLRIRKGPGTTYDYHKQNGAPKYTGKGVFTIVKVSEGQGAKLWGLLKSYADNNDGWIALDEAYGHRA